MVGFYFIEENTTVASIFTQTQTKFIFLFGKIKEYSAAVNVLSSNPCVKTLSRIKIPFFVTIMSRWAQMSTLFYENETFSYKTHHLAIKNVLHTSNETPYPE